MADEIASEIVGLERLNVRLSGAHVPGAVAATVRQETAILAETVKARMAALFRNPARMQAAVGTQVNDTGEGAEGIVFAQGLPYLRIQEYGGTTRPHVILPVHGKVLAFLSAGGGFKGLSGSEMVFTRKVMHPGSRIPERSYMRSALAMRRNAIIAALRGSVITAMAAE